MYVLNGPIHSIGAEICHVTKPRNTSNKIEVLFHPMLGHICNSTHVFEGFAGLYTAGKNSIMTNMSKEQWSNVTHDGKSKYSGKNLPQSHMSEERGVYRVLVGKPEGKRQLGRPRRRWVDNIGRISRWDVGMWTGLGWPRVGTGGGRL